MLKLFGRAYFGDSVIFSICDLCAKVYMGLNEKEARVLTT